ncbi:calcium-binding protein [Planktothrix agardhii]|uniref:calcium-binding protein n=1 Tax=Planktothrix agardhii TaxID=1160 RepID=UPI002B1EB964|nr:calcium-binding protein [Planktothrix agardhii]MEA5563690.1 calcium-binding protein [Planktothrix agardhii UHCC 0887]
MKLSMQQVNYLEQLTVQYATQEDHDGDCEGGVEGEFNVIQGGNGDEILEGGAGRDEIFGGNGQDVLQGGAGFDHLNGENGDDVLYGGKGKDNIEGGNGDDLLIGGCGPDTLIGDHGNDVLDGGNSPDVLTGGHGNDIFVLRLPGGGMEGGGMGGGGHSETECDVITDFQIGVDLIALGNQFSYGNLSFAGEYISVINSSDGSSQSRVLVKLSGIDTQTLKSENFFTL